MARSKRFTGYGYFMVQTLVIHAVFLISIFDIYFTSPLLHGMEHHSPKLTKSPAQRLVLFIADGLRADKCFDDPAMTFVREKALLSGSWRVSHTRVPTESRPGHVAIIAGFYEDVSAVAKGWQENPVEFDSVFNQSYKTWAFGNPDIIKIFTKDNSKNNIIPFYYPTELHDFAGSDLTVLDKWCIEKVEEFFQSTQLNVTLTDELTHDKTVFFVYLPGIDMNGHRYNPFSNETHVNMQLVDDGIRRITSLIDGFYGDSRTAYIMTSDHGMTPWGTHGSGLNHETLTPMVAWGAGVASLTSQEISMSAATSMLQADIAPFMSALLGISFPVNNVGNLHTDLLSVSVADKAELKLTNTRQIVEQFKVSVENKRKTTFSWLFRPYASLSVSGAVSMLRDISSLIKSGQHERAIASCDQLIELALDGITYYHKYDRLFLGACITLGFAGWIFYTLVFLIERFLQNSHVGDGDFISPQLWWSLRIVIILLAYSMPMSHILYCLVPTFPIQYIVEKRDVLLHFLQDRVKDPRLSRNILLIILVILGLEVMVLSFFERRMLSLAMLVLAVTEYKRFDWLLSCIMLAVFPLLPAVGRGANYYMVVSCGIFSAILLLSTNIKSRMKYFQVFLLVLANLVVMYTSNSIDMGQGLPLLSQCASWIILILTWILPLAEEKALSLRGTTVVTGLFTLYLLMSTSYELWFLLCLILFLYCWNKKELSGSNLSSLSVDFTSRSIVEHQISMDDVRTSFIYLLSITLAFFGTGNIASLNSFEPASMFCFLTVFNPFSMAALLLLKVIIPFIVVACGFHIITSQTGTKQDGVFLIILLMSDLMGMHFFMWVQDYGSWLDIGTSISHYVITLVTTLVLIILSKFSQFIMTYCILPAKYYKSFSHKHS